MTAAGSRSMRLLALAALILVLVTAWGLVAQQLPQIQVPISQHALERHGDDATIAHQCLDGRKGYQFLNPTMHRRAMVCWLDDRWGFVILDKDMNEVTSWVSKKLDSLEDVIEYMARQGYY